MKNLITLFCLTLFFVSCQTITQTEAANPPESFNVFLERGVLRLDKMMEIEEALNEAFPDYHWYIVFEGEPHDVLCSTKPVKDCNRNLVFKNVDEDDFIETFTARVGKFLKIE